MASPDPIVDKTGPQTRTFAHPAVNSLRRILRKREGKIDGKSIFGDRGGQQLCRTNGAPRQDFILPPKGGEFIPKEKWRTIRLETGLLPDITVAVRMAPGNRDILDYYLLPAIDNRFTLSYAKVLLAATRPEHLTDPARPKKLEGMSATDIARMEHEMERLRRDYRSVEDSLGDIMLSLVVTRGYVAKLFRNEAVADYIDRHHAELAMEMRGILEAVGSDARTLGR